VEQEEVLVLEPQHSESSMAVEQEEGLAQVLDWVLPQLPL
jgi:hypothetical protein